MAWWRDARFGMFIHWGLYSIPAGKWGDKTGHGEWIRDTARIPVDQYEQFRDQFNPVKFNADAWVSAARGAGMKYVVITTKHHDGFCLFDSKHTDWDVMSTPYGRDIMKQMAEACRRQGLTICWYHSIMDWHHPDYLPRRPWEEKQRPADGADFERFNAYLKNQVAELLTNYGPIGVMWFDGQWEGTWTHQRGMDLAAHVRALQPHVVINNRVDKGGGAMQMTRAGGYAGDFGTPEQEIPPTGFPGVDWETCMTMNGHWGYNAADQDFKSTEDLIRKLADIASKGGNFLLNVGPTSEGEIPATSLERLAEIGRWMDVNGESIHGTQAGPFEKGLPWGRCTMRPAQRGEAGITRLYLHVFDWPSNGRLVVPGLFNDDAGAWLLGGSRSRLAVSRADDALVIDVPAQPPDAIDSVVVLEVRGTPDVATAPVFDSGPDIFVGTRDVPITTDRNGVTLRYTLDGADPTPASAIVTGPVQIDRTATISARAFRGDRSVSPIARREFRRQSPAPAANTKAESPGVSFEYFEGDWNKLPDFGALTPANKGRAAAFDRRPRKQESNFGFRYRGYVRIPADGVYTFWLASDDGSNLYLDERLLIDNDGLHSLQERSGSAALAAGLHAIMIDFFEKDGGHELDLWMAGPGLQRKRLEARELVTDH